MNFNINYCQNSRPEMRIFLPDRYLRVLEIGCSDCAFSANLDSNAEIWGVEPNPATAEAAKKITQHVLRGTYEEVKSLLPVAYFDLIICNDVIEHMVDHELFLRQIRSHMAPLAYLVGSVPNMRHIGTLYQLIIHKDWPYRNQGVLDRSHLRFFTEKSLRRAIESNGFIIEMFAGINSVINFASRGFFKKLLLRTLCIGYFNDTQYCQFGFRARATGS